MTLVCFTLAGFYGTKNKNIKIKIKLYAHANVKYLKEFKIETQSLKYSTVDLGSVWGNYNQVDQSNLITS